MHVIIKNAGKGYYLTSLLGNLSACARCWDIKLMRQAAIFWFRQDLRLTDNPGLIAAARCGQVLPVYIFDNVSSVPLAIGSASKLYLHHSLASLDQALQHQLNFYLGEPSLIILQLLKQHKIVNVFWNRCYEPWYVAADELLVKQLRALKINYAIFNGAYLWDPTTISNASGSYYKVFAAYKRKVLAIAPSKPVLKPENLSLIKDVSNKTVLDDLLLLNSPQCWQHKIMHHWSYGESAAQQQLDKFINNALAGYKTARDYPAQQHTSKLSAHLHFGEISPQQIWAAVTNSLNCATVDGQHFLSELIWREFSCYLLTYFNRLPVDNLQNKFNTFPWRHDHCLLQAWQYGNTGYPLIDAGMRELWQTGYMHNRVRMIVASFLVKNLLLHWHYGRDWFWDCLIDADLANNSASWQWVAGCGVDAAPYFRIFNPISQGEKFDSQGEYTRKFVPELKNLADKYLFKPWAAPTTVLKVAGIILGDTYPYPIVDLAVSRQQALAAYKSL
jgi:deoxyribodipyrimidine photo-lyase